MAAEDEWKFSQCFGEKADAEDLTDGACEPRHAALAARSRLPAVRARKARHIGNPLEVPVHTVRTPYIHTGLTRFHTEPITFM